MPCQLHSAKIKWEEKCDSGWKTVQCYKNVHFYHTFIGFLLLLESAYPLLGTQISKQYMSEIMSAMIFGNECLLDKSSGKRGPSFTMEHLVSLSLHTNPVKSIRIPTEAVSRDSCP